MMVSRVVPATGLAITRSSKWSHWSSLISQHLRPIAKFRDIWFFFFHFICRFSMMVSSTSPAPDPDRCLVAHLEGPKGYKSHRYYAFLLSTFKIKNHWFMGLIQDTSDILIRIRDPFFPRNDKKTITSGFVHKVVSSRLDAWFAHNGASTLSIPPVMII